MPNTILRGDPRACPACGLVGLHAIDCPIAKAKRQGWTTVGILAALMALILFWARVVGG